MSARMSSIVVGCSTGIESECEVELKLLACGRKGVVALVWLESI